MYLESSSEPADVAGPEMVDATGVITDKMDSCLPPGTRVRILKVEPAVEAPESTVRGCPHQLLVTVIELR